MKAYFVGDVSLGEHYFSFGHGTRTTLENGIDRSNFLPRFSSADMVIGNLEGPISDKGLDSRDPESLVFRGGDSSANWLSGHGFTGMSIANNHIAQHGIDCFHDSISKLSNAGIASFGIANQEVEVLECRGIKVGVLSCSDVPDNTDEYQSCYQTYSIDLVASKVAKVRSRVDWVILLIHWGLESESNANNYLRHQAAKLYDVGVDLIIGHHPHIVYDIEKSKNKLSVYSLGNFIFDLPWDRRMKSTIVLEIDFKKDTFEANYYKGKIESNHLPKIDWSNRIPVKEGVNPLSENTETWIPNQVSKFIYFWLNIYRGKKALKIKFITRKILLLVKDVFHA